MSEFVFFFLLVYFFFCVETDIAGTRQDIVEKYRKSKHSLMKSLMLSGFYASTNCFVHRWLSAKDDLSFVEGDSRDDKQRTFFVFVGVLAFIVLFMKMILLSSV